MIQFTKPQNLNGAELLNELKAAGVTAKTPTIDGNTFWLDLDASDKAKAQPIVAAHNGTMVAAEPNVTQKLASVGLSVDDLKAALGL